MAEFTVSHQRHDPYPNFKYLVKWDGRYVAGMSTVRGLEQPAEVVGHRGGGDPSTSPKSPGRTQYEPITLERGVTQDPDFAAWAAEVSQIAATRGTGVSLASFGKDVILDLYDEAGQLATSYRIYGCWVSEYQALPDPDSDANAVAIQHIKLENEGWDRDAPV